MRLIVQKYGGTSVGSLAHIQNVARHVQATVAAKNRVIVTISAMGEQTDDLLEMAMQLNDKPPRRELDMLLSAGERISASLLAIALAKVGVKARSLTGSQCGILTDETHGNARIHKILGDRIRHGLDEGNVIIVAGFQGMSQRTKEITTLGRGGSDLSAVALAASLGAATCELYKDVPGVFTADPRSVPHARILPEISWSSMSALAWAGASVLQPRSAHLASKFNLPFEIRSSIQLDRAGTIVRGAAAHPEKPAVESPKVVALAHKTGTALVTYRFAKAAAIGEALAWLWQQGESPMLSYQQSPEPGVVELTLVLKASLVPEFGAALAATVVRRVFGLATITIVGEGFQQSPETVQQVCKTVGDAARMIDSRNGAITICVAEDQVTRCLGELHAEFLERP